MIGAALGWLRRLCAEVRDWQQDALAESQRLDAAVQQHMGQPAMWTADPLTDHLYVAMQQQVDNGGAVWPDEAGAPEVLHPRCTAGSGLTPKQWAALLKTQADDWWLDWLIPAIATGCVLGAAFVRLGWIRF